MMPVSVGGKSGAREDRRPWYRLHISTICLLVPAAAVLVLLVVPGERISARQVHVGEWFGGQQSFEHGWPYVHLRRKIISTWDDPLFDVPWLFRLAWSVQGDEHTFRPLLLAVDILVALVVLGLIAAGMEWRRRRHGHFWQYSVGEMLALTCLVAASLGWYQHNKQVSTREMRLVLASRVQWFPPSWEYRGPLWLRRLVDSNSLRDLHRVTFVALGGYEQFGDEDLRRRVEEIKALSSLDSLYICGPSVTDAGLECLLELPQLRTLGFWPRPTSITDAGLIHVGKLSNLHELSFMNTGITSAGLKHLRGLEQLEELKLVNAAIDDAGLVHLSGLKNLRVLSLQGTQLNGSGLLHLKNLENLERICMYDTPVETEYIDQFGQLQPQCYVMTQPQ